MDPNTDFCNYIATLHDLCRVTTDGGAVMQVIPPIKCADGFTFSVQASAHHYCHPKSNNGPWTEFEVGFPSIMKPILMPYIETDDGDPTNSVYPNVPIDIVVAIIDRHGGVV